MRRETRTSKTCCVCAAYGAEPEKIYMLSAYFMYRACMWTLQVIRPLPRLWRGACVHANNRDKFTKNNWRKIKMGNIYHWCCCWRWCWWWWCRCCCRQRCRRCRCCHYTQNCLNSHYWYSFRQCYTDPRRLVLASADDFWHLLGVALRKQWSKVKEKLLSISPTRCLAIKFTFACN